MVSESQEQHHQAYPSFNNEFASKRIVKRDFWLIPIYVFSYMVLPIILGFLITIFWGALNPLLSEKYLFDYFMNATSVCTIIGQLLFLLSFYLMHRKTIVPIAISRFKALRKHIILIIGTIVLIYLFSALYGYAMEFLPEKFQFEDTENNKEIAKMFTHGWLIPFLYIDIAILTPFVEELLFRHLLIHELGKKLTYGVMYVISIVIFAGVHCIDAKSPFEIGPYLIIATGIVAAYHFSGRNLATTITMHMTINTISFIMMVFTL
ncbi:CPBP family intramembrane glutamic endopeptidase [Staphylococcus caprae]|mgnify:FL=1|uniref:CAAX amino terminal protease family protein n=1 Tax=Staphylococcus caprae TaxID=29380 RepID=A0ABM7FT49_9STAP|nr:type II CAAX endopeptidase family protein [Staphylococcus caprae]EES41826.1 CAAX amino terminal protease family protein [Staphylococcus caprae M23864:W1]MBX5316762.1 CPBP family intramembrane metalloprotease [Staphylococcus caprae]MBX5323572.1 CPBP family intramembrane metalloprotease [Staphylococcus caprae]MDI0014458.1 type II CAAX endopeptidase family protein [Staphylococcus caprae]MEB8095150.1 CPBP family intramembrane metalloprotease [Staphylococcus caprae]